MKAFGINRIGLGLLGIILLGAGNVSGQASDNVVGMFNMTIQPGESFVAFPYQKPTLATGRISANAGSIVTAAPAAWVWKSALNEPGESTLYIEITDGPFEGWYFFIDSINGDNVTLADRKAAELADGDLAGAGFKVIPANRVRDLFGEPGKTLLAGGASHRVADTITRWMGIAWGAPIYVNTVDHPASGRIAGHWYCNGQLADDMVIGRDEAVNVKIRGDAPISLRLVGDVSRNAHATVLEAGLHLVGGAACISEQLGTSGLTQVLQSARIAPEADNLFAWQGAWSAPVFRNSEDGKWYQGESEASGFQIRPAQGYMVMLRNPPVNNVWTRPSPLAE
jgi:hypothetical protein